MTPEVAVIIAGLVVGYVGVSKLLFKQQPTRPAGSHDGPEASERPPEPRPRTQRPWHEVLDVPPTATKDEIKAAYRVQMMAYHPDKVQTLGQEIRDLAEAKAKEISVAYREALDMTRH